MGTFRSQSGVAGRRTLWIVAIGLVILFVVLKASTVVIQAGMRGVVYSKTQGVLEGAYDEGMHLIVPFIWEVIPYDVRSQTYTLGSIVRAGELGGGEPLDARTSDGQQVILDVSIRYHLAPGQVWVIHQSVGQEYVAKMIKPLVRGDARLVVANYAGNEIYSKSRYAFRQALEKRLAARLAPQHIIVEEVLVRNITFSQEFHDAIEQKQIAQQEALRMDYVVKKQRKEKEQAVILARGEAEAIRLKGRALASYPELVQWEYVNGLPQNLNVVVADTQTIISMGDLFQKQATPPPAQR